MTRVSTSSRHNRWPNAVLPVVISMACGILSPATAPNFDSPHYVAAAREELIESALTRTIGGTAVVSCLPQAEVQAKSAHGKNFDSIVLATTVAGGWWEQPSIRLAAPLCKELISYAASPDKAKPTLPEQTALLTLAHEGAHARPNGTTFEGVAECHGTQFTGPLAEALGATRQEAMATRTAIATGFIILAAGTGVTEEYAIPTGCKPGGALDLGLGLSGNSFPPQGYLADSHL